MQRARATRFTLSGLATGPADVPRHGALRVTPVAGGRALRRMGRQRDGERRRGAAAVRLRRVPRRSDRDAEPRRLHGSALPRRRAREGNRLRRAVRRGAVDLRGRRGRLLRPEQRDHRRTRRPPFRRDDEGDDPRPRARPQPGAEPPQPALAGGRLGHEALGDGDERLHAHGGRHCLPRRRGRELPLNPGRGARRELPGPELREADVAQLDGAGAAHRRPEPRSHAGRARRAEGGRARPVDGADGRELRRTCRERQARGERTWSRRRSTARSASSSRAPRRERRSRSSTRRRARLLAKGTRRVSVTVCGQRSLSRLRPGAKPGVFSATYATP